MCCEITVPQSEPNVAVEPFERGLRVKGVGLDTPARRQRRQAGKCVDDRVDIRGDIEAVEFLVIACVYEDSDIARIYDPYKTTQEPSRSDSPSQQRDPAAGELGVLHQVPR